MTGLEPRERSHIPLASPGLDEFASRTDLSTSGPTIRVVVDDRVTFFVLSRVQAAVREGDLAAGVDKGFNALVTLSTGEPDTSVAYGSRSGILITEIADAAVAAAKHRRRVAAHGRSLRNSLPDRAKRMRRRNLGTLRSSRFRRDRAQLREHVDESLNGLFREQHDVTRLSCEDRAFRSSPLSRSLNRRLGRWLKGYLHQRLIDKAELNGVELSVVNAAYTSQTARGVGSRPPRTDMASASSVPNVATPALQMRSWPRTCFEGDVLRPSRVERRLAA